MKKVIFTNHAPAPIGPYSQAIEINGFLFISGQIAIDPVTNLMFQGDVSAEASQVMKNIEAILMHADCSFTNVVKSTIFLKDMHDFSAVNEVYGKYFSENPPARETVAVVGLPKNAKVEISVIAVK